jgi:L-amino acid N-acyltransferase YncA
MALQCRNSRPRPCGCDCISSLGGFEFRRNVGGSQAATHTNEHSDINLFRRGKLGPAWHEFRPSRVFEIVTTGANHFSLENNPLEGLYFSDMASRGRSKIIVRRAEQRDCARLSQIYNDAIRSGVSTMDTELVDARYFIRQLGTLTDREVLLVGEGKAGIVGWSVANRYSDRPGYLHTCETSVYVGANLQGKGFGAVLQQAVVERADAFGYRHLVAKILAVNEWSIEFHKRFHYEIVGTQRKIGFLNGQWHDVVIMQRILDAGRQGQ